MRDPLNFFDGSVTIVGLIDLCIHAGIDDSKKNVLVVFRVLRVIRILRSLKFMKTIVNVIRRSMQSFIYIFLLLWLLLLVYALMGRNIFAGAFKNPKILYRENFDSYGNAIIAVFQVLTGTAWQYILHLAMNSEINKIISTFYLISWIVIGNYIFLNLFLAIIIGEFNKESQNSLKISADQEENELKKEIDILMKEENNSNVNKVSSFHTITNKFEENISTRFSVQKTVIFEYGTSIIRIRRSCKKIIEHSFFSVFMQIIIFLSSVTLIIDSYNTNPKELSLFVFVFDYLLNTIFLLEFLLKGFTYGVFWGKDAYMKNQWNILDFLILVMSFFYSILSSIYYESKVIIVE